jgi:hypothetical protein
VTGPQDQPQPPYASPAWDPHASAQQQAPWTAGYGPVPQPGAPVTPYGGARPETETKSVVALICAVASFVAFPLVPAIAALVLARSAQRDIDASGGRLSGHGLNTAARVIAWVNIALCAVVVLVVVAIVVAAFSGADFS